MSLNINKPEVVVPLSLDVMKLVDKSVSDVLSCVAACFHHNGNLAESSTVRNLHIIKGEMSALKNLLSAIS